MPRFSVHHEVRLLDFLKGNLPDWKTTTLRQRLKNDLVLVDGRSVRSGAASLRPGMLVEVLSADRPAGNQFPPRLGPPPLEILYADDALLAVNKPSGLLSVASERERHLTAIRLMREWLAGGEAEAPDLHAAHRLDRDASGVLLLARSVAVKRGLAAAWHTFEKVYAAVVDGIPPHREGSIAEPLWEDRGLFVRVGDGEDALTHYRLIRSARDRSLLEIRLGTGRKHQIRVHLAHIGCPIVGDSRYGVSKAPRLALHAERLRITHPVDGRSLELVAPVPPPFSKLLFASSPRRRPRKSEENA